MELRQLKYFVTVAEELNFRRAAERLFMEQPPLSRQIRQLEDELSVELFYRSRRGVTLTPAGQAFLDEARLTLAQAERAAKVAQQAVQPKKLTVGFSICAFNRVLPEIIQSYRQQLPDVVVTLTEMSTEAQIQALLNGTIDIGFVHAPISHPALLTVTLLSEPLVVALPSNHPLTHQAQIDLRSLANEPFIVCPESVKPDLYGQFMRLCQEAGFSPQIVQEASPPEVVLGFVASGMGVSLVASGAEARHSAGVTYRALSTPTPLLEIAAAWRKQQVSPVLEDFLALVKQA
ncbi:LysR family transcriptional regulator [Pseudanabaena sp. FACHB-2040]|uniref:LysR family transcriptional regulator n=1 Tax=Pseudanabaena sp. FACHB-2040 TaxID=2692859 RepID=UPI0016892D71|nr:LysR family transcriptional regulator [Pseudanabaena sp. FACHB-2040]MBD2258300.1 LysR family transcriptional regulator [Pseudanabaena sp. FACHB-2040]